MEKKLNGQILGTILVWCFEAANNLIVLLLTKLKSFIAAPIPFLELMVGRMTWSCCLIESHCIPLLSYAIEVVHVADRDERRQLRVAYNSVFRKIFCYRWSQSVTMLQTFLKRPTWEQLVKKRKNDFLVRVNKSSADTLARVLMAWHFCHGQMLFINDVFILYFCCCIVSWKLPLYYTNQPSVWIQTNHYRERDQRAQSSCGRLWATLLLAFLWFSFMGCKSGSRLCDCHLRDSVLWLVRSESTRYKFYL